jgi:hypothetical protein
VDLKQNNYAGEDQQQFTGLGSGPVFVVGGVCVGKRHFVIECPHESPQQEGIPPLFEKEGPFQNT